MDNRLFVSVTEWESIKPTMRGFGWIAEGPVRGNARLLCVRFTTRRGHARALDLLAKIHAKRG